MSFNLSGLSDDPASLWVFLLSCQLWHIRAFTGVGVSFSAGKSKQAGSHPWSSCQWLASMNHLYLGKQVLQGLMEVKEEEGSQRRTARSLVHPILLDVVFQGRPPSSGLSFSTFPHCSNHVFPSAPSYSFPGLVFCLSKVSSDARKTQTSKPQHVASHAHTLLEVDIE